MAGQDDHSDRPATPRPAAPQRGAAKAERERRLAAALRENLRRRKAQARGRAAAPAPAGETGEGSADDALRGAAGNE
jgi:hypothetical protein